MTIFRNIENWTGDNTGLVETVQHKDSNGTIISSYDELTDKPLINGVILQGDVSLDDLNIQPKGDYVSSEDIPSKISELENDKGYLTNVPEEYITKDELDKRGYLTEHQDLSGYAKNTDVPTKVSQLTNDKNYITSIPEEYITENELNAKGFITSYTESDPTVPAYVKNIKETDINNWNAKSEFSGDYNDLSNKPAIPSINGLATEKYVNDAVDDAITEIVGAAPETLDTLAELAEGLVANRNVVEVLNDAIEQKANSKDLASLEDSVDALQIQIDNMSSELPIASVDVLGGIKVGDNLTIDETGILSAISNLPVRTDLKYAVDFPEGLTVATGGILYNSSINRQFIYAEEPYLFLRYSNEMWCIKRNSEGISFSYSSNITSSSPSRTDVDFYKPKDNLTTQTSSYSLSAKQGYVLKGLIDDLQEQVNNINPELPVASSEILGGIKVGKNLEIDAEGILSSLNDKILPIYENTTDDYMYLSDLPDGVFVIAGPKWKNNPLTTFDLITYDGANAFRLIIKRKNRGFYLEKDGTGYLGCNYLTEVSSNYTGAGTSNTYRLYQPVKNLTTTTSGKPLDATQGKVLNDKITELQGEINSIKSTLEGINNTLAILTTPEEEVGE